MVIAPAHRAGDPGSNPGPGENFFLKLLTGLQVLMNGTAVPAAEDNLHF